jgi:restriction system protein
MRRSPILFVILLSAVFMYWGYVQWAIIAVIAFYIIRISWWLLVFIRRHFINHRLAYVDTMSGEDFERYICNVLRKQGYSGIRLTEKYDYGVDIIASKDGIKWGIQAKRYSGLVKAAAVRQVVTGLSVYGCDRAMVITNSVFSKVAIKLAKSNECLLVDRELLARLAAEY